MNSLQAEIISRWIRKYFKIHFEWRLRRWDYCIGVEFGFVKNVSLEYGDHWEEQGYDTINEFGFHFGMEFFIISLRIDFTPIRIEEKYDY